MDVKVPKEWEALWLSFDRAMALLVEAAGVNGVSCANVSALMRISVGRPATDSPAWRAWAAIKHNATSLQQLRDLAINLAKTSPS